MVDYNNAKIKMHIAEKLFRIGNDQVAIFKVKMCDLYWVGGFF